MKPGQRQSILVVSRDPRLADVRKHVLEGAGYRVFAASNPTAVMDTCNKEQVHLVMIGHSLAPAEKRRIWVEARKHCRVPILELHSGGRAELMDESNTYTHQSQTPEDFLEAAEAILRRARR